MSKYLCVLGALCMALLMSCSHSGVNIARVYGIDLSMPIPQCPVSLKLGYIESTVVYVRQNTSVKIDLDSAMGVNTKSTAKVSGNAVSAITLTTGAQANGYTVDMCKASPDKAADITRYIWGNNDIPVYVVKKGFGIYPWLMFPVGD